VTDQPKSEYLKVLVAGHARLKRLSLQPARNGDLASKNSEEWRIYCLCNNHKAQTALWQGLQNDR
jgi:hypothetical protein